MTRKEKNALLVTTLAGSQIPDIDVISAWWDTAGRYQMWHRGITHSIFLVPVWAALIAMVVRLMFKVRGWSWFWIGCLAVCIHSTSDIFNAWGTGYLEPLTSIRLTLGMIPIVDLVFWLLIAGGAVVVRFARRRWASHHVFRVVWLLIALHIGLQSVQGTILLQDARQQYDQVALSADFIPGVFTVVGKAGEQVVLEKGSIWTGLMPMVTLTSAEDADLTPLYEGNPRAMTLVEWSPFIVIVDEDDHLGVYDPRFYRNGASFLYEFIER